MEFSPMKQRQQNITDKVLTLSLGSVSDADCFQENEDSGGQTYFCYNAQRGG